MKKGPGQCYFFPKTHFNSFFMQKNKKHGYTLLELGLTLTLTGLLLLTFSTFSSVPAVKNHKTDYLSYFLTLETLLMKADQVHWDGEKLHIRFLYPNDAGVPQKKTRFVKCITHPEPPEKHGRKFLLPDVTEVTWFYWEGQYKQWQKLKPNHPYDRQRFRVCLLDKNHRLLEDFIF